MNRRSVKSERGVSIIETMVALMILAVSLLGLSQLLGLAVQQNGFARYNTVAIEIARGKLETLKASYNWELQSGVPSADLTDGNHGPETVQLASGSEGYGERSYSVSWVVSSPSTARTDIEILVRPGGVTNPEQDNPRQSKTLRIFSSFVP